MILLLGAHGYIGTAFAGELQRRAMAFETCGPAKELTFGSLRQALERTKAELVINCAVFIAGGRAVLCDVQKPETIMANAVLPQIMTNACEATGAALMHISTGCLYDEQREYEEGDAPTRDWNGYSGTYVGSKLLGEQVVARYPAHYILRIRLPFDEFDNPRNYLSKLAGFSVVFDAVNSMTHRGDFAKAALDLWAAEAYPGIYHCVNPGQVSAREVAKAMMAAGLIRKCPQFEEHPPVAGCRLATTKLLAAGMKVRPVEAALREAIARWTVCTKP